MPCRLDNVEDRVQPDEVRRGRSAQFVHHGCEEVPLVEGREVEGLESQCYAIANQASYVGTKSLSPMML